MDRQAIQKQIDSINWYHEFDFGDGLKTGPNLHLDFHRKVWAFVERNLDRIDFRGKSVLDIGCWDGYWSFYAEKRGARSVLASDDASQNWAGSQGLLLAKQLLKSRVETRLDVSVYDLASLQRKFDVILFLGVYYHLHDPFHALAQIRHCCHPETIVVIEGDGVLNTAETPLALVNYSDLSRPIYCPSLPALRYLAQGAYLTPQHDDALDLRPPPPPPTELAPSGGRLGWRWRLRMCAEALRGSREGVRRLTNLVAPPVPEPPKVIASGGRLLLCCKAFEGANPAHFYSPPFGLAAYDSRFREKCVA